MNGRTGSAAGRRKGIAAFLVFCVLLALALTGVNRVLTYKSVEGQGHWYEYYREAPGTVDVLFLGCSHAMRQINPAVLFHETGISGYVIATGGEALWSTYYCMEEALKYQHPKVVVVDIYMARLGVDHYEDTHNVVATFGMKRGAAWLGSIRAGVKENKAWYLLRYPLYHGRYGELDANDFAGPEELYDGLLKGFWVDENNWKTQPIDDIEYDDAGRRTSEMNAKCREYLLRMVTLARKEGVALVFLQTPGLLTEEETLLYNNIYGIAEREGVPYIEGNRYVDEIGLDEETDFRDKDHMNWRGSDKFSVWLAGWLAAAYDWEDRRGDTAYASWEADYAKWNAMVAERAAADGTARGRPAAREEDGGKE